MEKHLKRLKFEVAARVNARMARWTRVFGPGRLRYLIDSEGN